MKVKSLSRVRLLATPWTAAHQAPPSMGFSRQEHLSGVPLPSPPSEAGALLSGGAGTRPRLSFQLSLLPASLGITRGNASMFHSGISL